MLDVNPEGESPPPAQEVIWAREALEARTPEARHEALVKLLFQAHPPILKIVEAFCGALHPPLGPCAAELAVDLVRDAVPALLEKVAPPEHRPLVLSDRGRAVALATVRELARQATPEYERGTRLRRVTFLGRLAQDDDARHGQQEQTSHRFRASVEGLLREVADRELCLAAKQGDDEAFAFLLFERAHLERCLAKERFAARRVPKEGNAKAAPPYLQTLRDLWEPNPARRMIAERLERDPRAFDGTPFTDYVVRRWRRSLSDKTLWRSFDPARAAFDVYLEVQLVGALSDYNRSIWSRGEGEPIPWPQVKGTGSDADPGKLAPLDPEAPRRDTPSDRPGREVWALRRELVTRALIEAKGEPRVPLVVDFGDFPPAAVVTADIQNISRRRRDPSVKITEDVLGGHWDLLEDRRREDAVDDDDAARLQAAQQLVEAAREALHTVLARGELLLAMPTRMTLFEAEAQMAAADVATKGRVVLRFHTTAEELSDLVPVTAKGRVLDRGYAATLMTRARKLLDGAWELLLPVSMSTPVAVPASLSRGTS